MLFVAIYRLRAHHLSQDVLLPKVLVEPFLGMSICRFESLTSRLVCLLLYNKAVRISILTAFHLLERIEVSGETFELYCRPSKVVLDVFSLRDIFPVTTYTLVQDITYLDVAIVITHSFGVLIRLVNDVSIYLSKVGGLIMYVLSRHVLLSRV